MLFVTTPLSVLLISHAGPLAEMLTETKIWYDGYHLLSGSAMALY
jgi:hypothetical protein